MGRREKQGLWDGPVHTAVFKMDNQQGPTVQQGNSAQCYVAAWIDEELGGEWIHVHYGEVSLLSTCTVITLLISHTPIQNKKFNNNF